MTQAEETQHRAAQCDEPRRPPIEVVMLPKNQKLQEVPDRATREESFGEKPHATEFLSRRLDHQLTPMCRTLVSKRLRPTSDSATVNRLRP